MAAAELYVVIQDGKGKRGKFKLNSEILDGADLEDGATYESMGDNLLQDLEPVIDGQIISADWRLPVGFDFTPQTAAVDCDIEHSATFIWRTAGGYLTKFVVPTFKETLYIAGTKLVNAANAAVIDWVNTIIDGPDAMAGVPEDRFNMTDNRGDDIVALEKAYETFRHSRPPAS